MSLKAGPGIAANAIFELDKQDRGLLLFNGSHLQIPQQHQNRYLSHSRDIQGRLPKTRTQFTRKDEKSDDQIVPYLARPPQSSYQPPHSRTHTRPSERPWGPYT
jgi:hypothetical protein